MAERNSTQRARKPTASQLRALGNLAAGRDLYAHCRTMSDHGGMHSTLVSLWKNGWTNGRLGEFEITAEGRAVLAKAHEKRGG